MKFIEKILMIGDPAGLGYVGIHQLFIQMHIALGVVSLLAGGFVLLRRKGDSLHKKVGIYFIAAMMGIFFLGFTLGTFAEIARGKPMNFMTAIGGPVVGFLVFSAYRLVKAGNNAHVWYDKAMMAIGGLTVAGYAYFTVLILAGTSVFGVKLITLKAREQATISDMSFDLFQKAPTLIATEGGSIFAVMISENFVAPLFYALVLGFFVVQDWNRVVLRRKLPRPQLMQQHAERTLFCFGAAVSAALLNTGWLSFWACWFLPSFVTIAFSFYFRIFGYKDTPMLKLAQRVRAGTQTVVDRLRPTTT